MSLCLGKYDNQFFIFHENVPWISIGEAIAASTHILMET